MTGEELVQVCVIGAGRHSTAHIYPNLGRVGLELLGVCDLDPKRARNNTRLFGGTAYENYDRMLEREEPDAVIICIGPEAHAHLACEIMRLGYPVYTEKPPAPDAATAKTVVDCAEVTGKLCMTGFKKRYAAPYVRASEWIEGFAVNSRVSITVDYASGAYRKGNFLLDFAIHQIDLVDYLFGRIEQVSTFVNKGNTHAYAVSLSFETGAIGTLMFTDARSFSVPTEEVEITLAGGNWMSIHNSSKYRIVEEGEPVDWHEPPTFVSGGEGDASTGHVKELEAFVDAVRNETKPASHIRASYRSMVLYEAILEAAVATHPVDVTY